MAEDNAAKDGDKLAVDPQAIRTSAAVPEQWGTFLNNQLPKIRASNPIAPGNFPEAEEFKSQVTARINELVENVERTNNALKTIGADLRLVADAYQNTHKVNGDDAQMLYGLVNDVEQFLPGAKDTLPAPVSKTTYQLSDPK